MENMNSGNKEQTLHHIIDELEELKSQLAETTESYEESGADDDTLDLLGEALESVDTAIDAIYDVVNG